MADAPRRIIDDGRRLGELRDIVGRLEARRFARRSRPSAGGRPRRIWSRRRSAALEAALSGEAVAGREAGTRAVREAAGPADALQSPPPGHPLELLRREAELLRQLRIGLEAELDRLGGSPARRRWQQEKPMVARLVDRLSGIELRFRREQQAWFPALGVYGVDGPREMLVSRQQEALETLRRLRLAVERDDSPSAVEAGVRLLGEIDDLLAQDERLLEPLSQRHFSAGDWAAVRELEDGVGWALIQAPPPGRATDRPPRPAVLGQPAARPALVRTATLASSVRPPNCSSTSEYQRTRLPMRARRRQRRVLACSVIMS